MPRIAAITFLFFLFWLVVGNNPIGFWHVAMDGPTFSLGHALNLLGYGDFRVVGNPEVAQPGVWYQIVSYLIAIVSSSLYEGDLFNSLIEDPSKFWIFLEFSPILLTVASLIVYFHYVHWRTTYASVPAQIVQPRRALGRTAALASFLLLTVNPNFFRYNMWELFNESFAFLTVLVFVVVFDRVLYTIHGQGLDKLKANAETAKLIGTKDILAVPFLLLGMSSCAVYFQKLPYLALPIAAFITTVLIFKSNPKLLIRSLVYQLTGFLIVAICVGLPFFGKAGFHEMVDTHFTMLMRDGYYRGGENKIINPDIFKYGLLSIFNQFKHFIYIGLSCVVGTVIRLRLTRGAKLVFDKRDQYFLVFTLLSTIIMCVGIAKHFQPYYTLSISALFPFLLLPFLQRTRFVSLVLVATLAFLALPNAMNERKGRAEEAAIGQKATRDEQKILELGLDKEEFNVWFYRVVAATGYRMTLIQFSSLYHLQEKFLKINGPNIEGSPWNSFVFVNGKQENLQDVKWKRIVMDKRTRDYIKTMPHHSWLFSDEIEQVDLEQLMYFRRR